MEHAQTESFKKQLLRQRAELLAQLANLRGGNVSRVQASVNHFGEREPDSRGQTETERQMEFTLDEREGAELDTVEAALRRIADGSYGVCVDCGTDIPVARLHATPETSRCVTCQTRNEQRHRA